MAVRRGTALAVSAGALIAGGALGIWVAAAAGLADRPVVPPDPVGYLAVLGRNTSVVCAMALGALTLGAVTLAVLAFNGAVLGAAVHILLVDHRAGELWTGLAPHLLPETGAFLLAATADLRLAGLLLRWLATGERPAARRLLRDWAVPQAAALAVLAVAALIETTVSTA